MKLYKTTGMQPISEGRYDKFVSWQGSQTEASKARTALRSQGCKRDNVTSQEMDVPTTKDALLEWLNKNVKV